MAFNDTPEHSNHFESDHKLLHTERYSANLEERASTVLKPDGWNNNVPVRETDDEFDWPMGRHVGSKEALKKAAENYTVTTKSTRTIPKDLESEKEENTEYNWQNRADLQ